MFASKIYYFTSIIDAKDGIIIIIGQSVVHNNLRIKENENGLLDFKFKLALSSY